MVKPNIDTARRRAKAKSIARLVDRLTTHEQSVFMWLCRLYIERKAHPSPSIDEQIAAIERAADSGNTDDLTPPASLLTH
jgi:hypothetical protein